MSPVEIRKQAKLSLAKAATYSDTSEMSIRLYEASPSALSPDTREKIESFYAKLERGWTPPRL